MGYLDSSCGWGRFAGSLGGQLFPGGLASGGFTGVFLTPMVAGADLPREDQDLTPSLSIGDTNHARQSSARADATTPAKAKKAESTRLYKRLPQTPTFIQFYCEHQTINMPPKTGKAAKKSVKASMAIAEDKKAKTPEKASKAAAIPALKEKKWTLMFKMTPEKAAIFRRELHSEFTKLNLNFGNHAPGCGCGM